MNRYGLNIDETKIVYDYAVEKAVTMEEVLQNINTGYLKDVSLKWTGDKAYDHFDRTVIPVLDSMANQIIEKLQYNLGHMRTALIAQKDALDDEEIEPWDLKEFVVGGKIKYDNQIDFKTSDLFMDDDIVDWHRQNFGKIQDEIVGIAREIRVCAERFESSIDTNLLKESVSYNIKNLVSYIESQMSILIAETGSAMKAQAEEIKEQSAMAAKAISQSVVNTPN